MTTLQLEEGLVLLDPEAEHDDLSQNTALTLPKRVLRVLGGLLASVALLVLLAAGETTFFGTEHVSAALGLSAGSIFNSFQEASTETVKAQVLKVDDPTDFVPPRSTPPAQVGIGFSGGGTRAYSAALGQVRALTALNLLTTDLAQRITISSSSGGSWFSALYTFVPDSYGTDTQLLGANTYDTLGQQGQPGYLNLDALKTVDYKFGKVATTTENKMIKQLNQLKTFKAQDEWMYVVKTQFLAPFGLEDVNSFVALSETKVAEIKAKNKNMENKKFYVKRQDRPYWIAGGTIFAPVGPWNYKLPNPIENMVSIQFSPDYTCSPFYPKDDLVSYITVFPFPGLTVKKVVGGGCVETWAFNGAAPKTGQNGYPLNTLTEVGLPQTPMSLAKIIAVSSSTGVQYSRPYVYYWPVTDTNIPEQLYEVGDAAMIDNTGLLQLLQSRTPKAIIFLNQAAQIASIDWCSGNTAALEDSHGFKNMRGQVPDSFDWFGYGGTLQAYGVFIARTRNTVFEKAEFWKMMCAFKTLKDEGKTAIYRKTLKVLKNDWWGIQDGTVDLTVVWLERVDKFEKKLPQETQDKINKGVAASSDVFSGELFKNYPWFSLAYQNFPEPMALEPSQVNILSATTEYGVRSNAAIFCEVITGSQVCPLSR